MSFVTCVSKFYRSRLDSRVIKLARERHAVQQACCLGFLCLECSLFYVGEEFEQFKVKICQLFFFEIVNFLSFFSSKFLFRVNFLNFVVLKSSPKTEENDVKTTRPTATKEVSNCCVFILLARRRIISKEKKITSLFVYFFCCCFKFHSLITNSRRTP